MTSFSSPSPSTTIIRRRRKSYNSLSLRRSARLAQHGVFKDLGIVGIDRKPNDSSIQAYLSAFRDRGVPGPTSECRRVPQPRWVEREGEREGGRARRPESGVREVGIPRPSCSSRAQVGCACSRGLQASTREREASGPKRAPVSSSSPRGQPSLRGPWSFLL
jgi:hypothetical protein